MQSLNQAVRLITRIQPTTSTCQLALKILLLFMCHTASMTSYSVAYEQNDFAYILLFGVILSTSVKLSSKITSMTFHELYSSNALIVEK